MGRTLHLAAKPCIGLALFLVLFFAGCGSDEADMRNSLQEKARSDLQDIVDEIHRKGIDSVLSEEPRFEVVFFKTFIGDTARVYQAAAEVHYFYLKSLKLYQIRKYRYKSSLGGWDRYEVLLKHRYDEPLKK